MKRENIANYVTSIRIVVAVIMLFVQPMSDIFLILFTIGGISDAIDGFVARSLHIASEFGKKLDSIADLLFFAISLIMILPSLYQIVVKWIWYVVAAVLVVRIISYSIYGYYKHELASNHTIFNKATSAMIFPLPYIMRLPFIQTYCYILVVVTIIAAIDDFIINIKAIRK